MKQVYKITYPTGKIYIGKDSVGSHRYFGSPNMDLINDDFKNLPKSIRLDYTIRKQILWESDIATEKELSEKIRKDIGAIATARIKASVERSFASLFAFITE